MDRNEEMINTEAQFKEQIKNDLRKMLRQAQQKSVYRKIIENKEDFKSVIKEAEILIRSKKKFSIFLFGN
jgi:hypothetical protein